MYIAPDSSIKLYGGVQIIPGRQIAFSSRANQNAYFASKLVQNYTPCTYVRKTLTLKAEVPLSVVKNCNYISFTNPSFENITWYAKIVNYEYVNNACTEIMYAIDYFQTFMFDVNFEVCTIDREQLSVDDYAKSEANPYDYSIVELRTNENIPLPDEVFDYPAIAGNRGGNTSKRTFLPSDYEGEDSGTPIQTAYQIAANNTMLYTIIVSSPVSSVHITTNGTGRYAIDSVDSIIPEADMKLLFRDAGLNSVLENIGNLPLGNNVPNIKSESSTLTTGDKSALSWLYWPDSDTPGEPIVRGYGCFGMTNSGVRNQTLILATNNFVAMQNILNIFTKNDAVSSIVGCYYLPLSFLLMMHAQSYAGRYTTSMIDVKGETGDSNSIDGANNQITVYKEKLHPIGFDEVKNKKLLTFPYQYIRVTAPNGTQKEYKFEDFTFLQTYDSGDENDFIVNFTILADMTNTPLLELYPYLYKVYRTNETDGYSFRHKLNIEERMEFSDFPQQAYMTDAYLAYVANEYSNQLRNEPMRGFDIDTEWQLNATNKELNNFYAKYDTYKMGKNGLLSLAADAYVATAEAFSGYLAPSAVEGALLKSQKNGMDIMQRGMEHASKERQLNTQANELNLRSNAITWGSTGEIGGTLAAAKPAFRTKNYMAGGGSGTLPYFTNGFKFTFDIMKIKPSFLRKFDDYLTNYGLHSTRTGVPHLATYLQGTKTGDAPKFLQNEQGYYVTYLKTVDCKVYSTMDFITDFFESLFDTGIQLIDGDTLIN